MKRSGVPARLWELLALYLSEDKRGPTPEHLAPSASGYRGVFYSVGEFQIPARDVLSSAIEMGLKVSKYVTFPSCAVCRSLALTLEVSCPSCGERDIRRIEIMVHYDCGYMGPAEDFLRDVDGKRSSCPKCGKEIKRAGIDYGRPGVGFRCERCGSIFQFPIYGAVCENGHKTSLDKVEVERFPVFEVTKTTLVNISVIRMVQQTAKKLASLYGFEVDAFAPRNGESNATHIVHMIIRMGGRDEYGVEVIDEAADPVQMMGSIAKALDLGMRFIILVDRGRAAKLAQIFNTSMFLIIPYSSGEEIADLIAGKLGIVA